MWPRGANRPVCMGSPKVDPDGPWVGKVLELYLQMADRTVDLQMSRWDSEGPLMQFPSRKKA